MKKTLKVIVIAIAAAAFLAAHAAAIEPFVKELKSPTFSSPAFSLPGGAIPVEFDVAADSQATAATLTGSLDGKQAAAVTLDVALKTGPNNFDFNLPADTAPGMYDLCISFTGADGSAKQNCQPHSVSVVKSFDAPFTFVQITDFHVGDPRAEQQFPGIDIERVRIAAIEEANKQNPAFILMTGDINSYSNSYDSDYPHGVKLIIDHAKAPTVIVPGNHDFYAWSDNTGKIIIDGSDYWPQFYGPKHRVLDFGQFRFICFNSYDWPSEPRNMNKEYQSKAGLTHTYSGTLSKSEYQWVKNALDTKGDLTPILSAHHSPQTFEYMPQQWCKDCAGQTKFLAMINKYKVPYYIYGHIHANSDVKVKDTEYIATTSAGSSVEGPEGEFWGIRIVNTAADRTISTKYIRLFDAPPMKDK